MQKEAWLMNLLYLPEHVSRILNTTVYCFDRNPGGLWQEVLSIKHSKGFIFNSIRELVQKPLDYPLLFSVGRRYHYALVPSGQYRVLMGPVQLTSVLQTKMDFSLPDGFPDDISLCETSVFLESALLSWNLVETKIMSSSDLIAANCADQANTAVQKHYVELSYDNRETGHHHNAYSQEVRLLGSIEAGDLKMLEQSQKEAVSSELGKLSLDEERSFRNACVVAIALASRAAIRGGLHPETAFSLCDSYIMKLESTPLLDGVDRLVMGAQTNFASLVYNLQKDKEKGGGSWSHPLVKKCENYVYDHLHGKTSLKEAARELGVAPNYLSTLFKKHKGISFSEFVMKEKIYLAKEMLVYSHLSYLDIALTLGFVSQSHLGEHFKKLTGMTPIQYRQRYAITEKSKSKKK